MTTRVVVPLLGAALVLACDGGVDIEGSGGAAANDLSPYYSMDDAEARANWQPAMSSWSETWDETLAVLADASLFPVR